MRVVRVREFGPTDVLRVEETDRPDPAPGQVLIRVEVVGVLFGETIIRRGAAGSPLPYVPGMEVGGEVVAAADQALIGKRVVATTAGLSGGYAEFALAEADRTHVVRTGLALEQAVAVFGAGGFAVGLLRGMGVGPEDTVLITAAAGRLGSLLVQLAKAGGARVIGAVGGPAKLAAVTGFGADLAVDYRDDDWVAKVEAAGGATVVLDAIGGVVGGQAIDAARDAEGRIGIYGFASGTWPELDPGVIAQRGLTVVGVSGVAAARSTAADVEQALASDLKPRIHATYALEQAAQAHDDLEQRRNIGAVLLRV